MRAIQPILVDNSTVDMFPSGGPEAARFVAIVGDVKFWLKCEASQFYISDVESERKLFG